MNLNNPGPTLIVLLGLTSLAASAEGFYRFEQWNVPAWGNPAPTPGTDSYQYYWYQPPQPLPAGQPGQTLYWYQYGQPLAQPQGQSPSLPPQPFQGPFFYQGPNYWYWFQPYY